MKKVATRADLQTITGRAPVPQVSAPAPAVLDPTVAAVQQQVIGIANAVGQLADAIHAQAVAHAMRPHALKGTIERDKNGVAQSITITRVQQS